MSIIFFIDRPTVSVSESTTISEGKPYYIECSAWGKPDSSFAWQHNKDEIRSTGQMKNFPFLIPSVSREHYGTYVCTATNKIGSDSQSTNLTVVCKYVFTTISLQYMCY